MKYLLLIATLMTNLAFASGSEEFSVLNIGAAKSGNYVFLDITPNQTVSNCVRKNQIRWELNNDIDKAMLSLAITAQTTGKKLRIAMTDDDCLGDAPRASVIYLLD